MEYKIMYKKIIIGLLPITSPWESKPPFEQPEF